MGFNTSKMLSVTQVAKILGISRMHVLRKIKAGEIRAEKVGKSFVIDEKDLPGIYRPLTEQDKKQVKEAVDKTVEEYGDVIRKLGRT